MKVRYYLLLLIFALLLAAKEARQSEQGEGKNVPAAAVGRQILDEGRISGLSPLAWTGRASDEVQAGWLGFVAIRLAESSFGAAKQSGLALLRLAALLSGALGTVLVCSRIGFGRFASLAAAAVYGLFLPVQLGSILLVWLTAFWPWLIYFVLSRSWAGVLLSAAASLLIAQFHPALLLAVLSICVLSLCGWGVEGWNKKTIAAVAGIYALLLISGTGLVPLQALLSLLSSPLLPEELQSPDFKADTAYALLVPWTLIAFGFSERKIRALLLPLILVSLLLSLLFAGFEPCIVLVSALLSAALIEHFPAAELREHRASIVVLGLVFIIIFAGGALIAGRPASPRACFEGQLRREIGSRPGLSLRLFNHLETASALLDVDVPPFIDSRIWLYSRADSAALKGSVADDYIELLNVRPDWRKVLGIGRLTR